MKSILLALALGAGAVAAQQQYPDTPQIFSSGLSVLHSELNALPVVATVARQSWPNTLPLACIAEGAEWVSRENQTTRCLPKDIEVQEVTYADCPGNPWVFCRCVNAPSSFDDMVREFGRLVVNLRVHVRNIMAFDGEGGAYSTEQDLIVLSPGVNPTVMIHEAGHSLERGLLSNSQSFLGAVGRDSCMADRIPEGAAPGKEYAEPWAQAFVLRRYQVQIGTLPVDTSCMKNQLLSISADTDSKLLGKTCNASKKIPKGPTRERTPDEIPEVQPSKLNGEGPTAFVVTDPVPTAEPTPESSAVRQAGDAQLGIIALGLMFVMAIRSR